MCLSRREGSLLDSPFYSPIFLVKETQNIMVFILLVLLLERIMNTYLYLYTLGLYCTNHFFVSF
ncbi:hypothetical protein QBC41DRAFT_319904 [Cercophora samala]|uniref:Uncharacterized protein n=1 Tax=Cercophora samala TaxID=330535 RepID=A0AA39ZEB7_9PEZI|nr:hypothetical protein QBC41DRAFT_319904 [Cercophora samala]